MRQPNILPCSLDGKELYQLAEDFPYGIRGKTEVARRGYILDGASVPRPFWPFLPKDGTHRAEALKHDWAYDGRGLMECGLNLRKHEVDLMFSDGLLRLGTIPDWKCAIIFGAVDLFGWKAWNEGDGTRLILEPQYLAPSFSRKKRKILRHIYDPPS